jgi:uncharacterized GH25 family protein
MAGFLGLLALAVDASPLHAHDFWIQPPSFRPTESPLPVRLLVGERFAGESLPRDPGHLERFVVVGPAGTAPVPGMPGRDPAGYANVDSPGLYVVGYGSRPNTITLEAATFEKYLADEGLERISAMRAAHGQRDAPAAEVYSRCAKSLVAVGEIDPAARDIALHFTLELVAEENPYRLPAGSVLPVRLFYRDEPLQGALVVARNHADPTTALASRTDGDGRAVLRLNRGGLWLIKAVHMIPAPPGSGADWESFWASLTFELPS